MWKADFNGNFAYAKNPRRLHLKVSEGEQEFWFEAAALSFAQVDREALLRANPDMSLSWGSGCLSLLLDWVAERFRQATFPDAFNKRLAPFRKGLDRLWKSEVFCRYASGVYINLNTFDELADEKNYQIKILIAIPYAFKGAEYREFDKKHSLTMITQLKALFDSVKDVDVISVGTLSERELTKEIERDFNRFSLEYFSYKGGVESNPLPAEYLDA